MMEQDTSNSNILMFIDTFLLYLFGIWSHQHDAEVVDVSILNSTVFSNTACFLVSRVRKGFPTAYPPKPSLGISIFGVDSRREEPAQNQNQNKHQTSKTKTKTNQPLATSQQSR